MSAPRRTDDYSWTLDTTGRMRVPAVLFANDDLMASMDQAVFRQLANVASLPGVVAPVCAMPDAHSGYGFPIGGVAAFDPQAGGVVSAGGVGFDIACGVRTLLTNVHAEEVHKARKELADLLFSRIPAGLGGGGDLSLNDKEMNAMLREGARWAVSQGFGERADLERCEENGRMRGANPDAVSKKAKDRQKTQVGTLGSGNHYMEVQEIVHVHDAATADQWGLRKGDAVVSIHCGSRGLGHQIGTDYLQRMTKEAAKHSITLPDKELACAPILADLGQEYLSAMAAGVNCALANRQVLSHLARECLAALFPGSLPRLLYDVSHNTCKEEAHTVNGREKRLYVHRKGATRSLPPGDPRIPEALRAGGQPVIVGGSMGAPSYILAGMETSLQRSFGSANHGAGRAMSRSQAKKRFRGRDIVQKLAEQGIEVRAGSLRGVGEEAPGAYKDVDAVIRTAHAAGLARPVATLRPMVCIKG